MKEQIIQLLKEAGFIESGTNCYVHSLHGRMFLKDFSSVEMVHKIMDLGAQHQVKKLRDALMLERQTECFIFQPSA